MHHEVVAFQEAGSGPPAEPHRTRGTGESIPIPGPFPAGLPGSVNHTQWEYRHHRRHVYFLQTDPRRDRTTRRDRWVSGRVNLAMVTHARADEVRARRPAALAQLPPPGAVPDRWEERGGRGPHVR
ncbi:hypothetical protein [Streptomyces sp. XH2]|uniref:hypothetical protein n=1 Tax=Streptomyces sp. XH2 TaxID=3412483 RepID=UPI003C7A0F4D